MEKEINILVTLELSEAQQSRLDNIGEDIQVSIIPANATEDIPDVQWQKTDVLYTQGILPNPDKAPNLKWIQFQSAGIDPFLAHPLMDNKDLIVTTMSGAINNQVAEYVLMTILAFGHKLPMLTRYQREQKWPNHDEKHKVLMPDELRYSTVGILGYGSIGRQVARLLKSFGATILATKQDVMHPEDNGYFPEGMGDPHGDYFDRLYPVEALHSLLGESDFVVVALPLTRDTEHLLDEKAFEAMRPSAYLINVARGAVVDQATLVGALQSKKIAGAALDVFEEEPLPADSPLWEMENVILSPHIAGLSRSLEAETLTLFIENLNRFLADLQLLNQIDLTKEY